MLPQKPFVAWYMSNWLMNEEVAQARPTASATRSFMLA